MVANPVDLCSTILNTAEMKDKVVIFRWTNCLTTERMQQMITADAAGFIAYLHDWYEPERFNVLIASSATGWTIPAIVLPGKEGELLRQLVEQRGAGVTLGISGPILPPKNKFENMASFSSLGPTHNWLIKPDLVALRQYIFRVYPDGGGGRGRRHLQEGGQGRHLDGHPGSRGRVRASQAVLHRRVLPLGEKKSSDASSRRLRFSRL